MLGLPFLIVFSVSTASHIQDRSSTLSKGLFALLVLSTVSLAIWDVLGSRNRLRFGGDQIRQTRQATQLSVDRSDIVSARRLTVHTYHRGRAGGHRYFHYVLLQDQTGVTRLTISTDEFAQAKVDAALRQIGVDETGTYDEVVEAADAYASFPHSIPYRRAHYNLVYAGLLALCVAVPLVVSVMVHPTTPALAPARAVPTCVAWTYDRPSPGEVGLPPSHCTRYSTP